MMFHRIALGVGMTVFALNAGAESFADWKQSFYQKAQSQGVSAPLLAEIQLLTPYQRAVSSDRNQSEFKKFLWDYLNTAVSTSRVQTGRQKFAENRALFERIGHQSGVAPQVIAAIWGMETSYGGYTGKVPVMQAMAALAHEGRRRAFFESEMLSALKLMARGDIQDFNVQGSWAGGLGIGQFIPSSYLRYGIDDNADGRVDLWQLGDGLASIGNYLSGKGWNPAYGWGREVTLPQNFNYLQANTKTRKTLSQWQQLGVRGAQGESLANGVAVEARLFVPAGKNGPKFLLYKNFDVIKRYNNSDSYALAVSLLSERIAGGQGLQTAWPNNARKMTKNDIKIVQAALNFYGFDAGKVDGVFGNGTRRALQSYQAANGLIADGFMTVDLYRKLVTNR